MRGHLRKQLARPGAALAVLFEGLERGEHPFEGEVPAFAIGPEEFGQGAVRAEHDHQPLAWPRGSGQAEARQAHEERKRCGGEPDTLDELAAVDGVHGRYSLLGQRWLR